MISEEFRTQCLFALRLPFQQAHAKDSRVGIHIGGNHSLLPIRDFIVEATQCSGLRSKTGSSICVASANRKHALFKNDEEFQGGSSSALN